MTRGTLPPVMLPATTHAAAPVELVDRLRQWRLETARASGVPAYVVFHDSTLNAIAAARPASLAELLRVSGVGESKLRKYGEEVLEVLQAPTA
jgi:ATP-dependent DNA helicase RecQ